MPKSDTRLNRVNEELKKEISQVISFELKNPNITGLISVTKVKVTPDLRFARVYVSLLNSKNIKNTTKILLEKNNSKTHNYQIHQN